MKVIVRLIIFCLIFTSQGYAVDRDLWQWSTLSLDKKISKKITASLDEEVRLFQNISQLNLCFTNVGLSYKVSKVMKVSLTYRSIQKMQNDRGISFRHRIYSDLSLKTKCKILALGYRARVQSQVRDYSSSEKGSIPETYLRNKFEVKFDFDKPIVPYIATEFRYQLRNAHNKESNNMINRGRYYIGFDYKLSDMSSFGFYYMLQADYNVVNAEHDSVLGISYSISL